MKKLAFSILLFYCSLFLYAEIIECHKFADVKSYLNPLDIVFTEIDEILIGSDETIASIPFLNHLKQNWLYEGLSLNQAHSKLNDLWSNILQKAHFHLKEKELSYHFKELQKNQIAIFGFTARPFTSQSLTLKLLQQNELFFDTDFSIAKDNSLMSTVSNGVFFISFDQRFATLDTLFKDNCLNLSRVVFIDYNLMNLVQTQLYFEEKKIPFLGIFFPIPHLIRDDYSIQIGQIQLKYLNTILPNCAAKSLIYRD